MPEQLRRVIVVGPSASGKTTMGAWLAQHLGLPHVELDALHWGPNWQPRDDLFLQDVERATREQGWVLDGNYSESRRISWVRADTIVWLDFSLPCVLWRLTRRTIRRVLTHEELWNSNKETLWGALFAPDNLFAYTVRTWRKRRASYEGLMRGEEYAHLQWVRLRSPRDADRWQRELLAMAQNKKELSPKG